MVRKIRDDLVLVLAGQAGQGIQSIETILSYILKRSSYNYFSTSELMSRVRGGINSTEIRISSQKKTAFIDKIDILIPLHNDSIKHLEKRISPETIVIGEKDKIDFENLKDVHFTQIAKSIGNAIYSNSVAAGYICGLLKVDLSECQSFILDFFADKSEEIKQKNMEAISAGHELARNHKDIDIIISKSAENKDHLIIDGAKAISLGALAGACNFVCGYPMSPATGVLQNMASLAKKFDIIVEQVEDEVGVVNMALGAWYAGARAMTSTSGGGFALMSEGLSLCGMMESPMVFHIAQRPGPATGLATRTEQGDLNLVLYAGHGDFPRIILAPATLEEGFYLTQKAFNLADRYQVPVFILSDQYFINSKYNLPPFSTTELTLDRKICESTADYKRYALSDYPISPRSIPAFGKGFVCSGSNEHDENGRITEDQDIRCKMTDKRLKKEDLIKEDIIAPKFQGIEDYYTLIISWGSTYHIVAEALAELQDSSIAHLHFSWIYPFPEESNRILKKAKKIIIIENNAKAHFAQLIQLTSGIKIENKILKYNGRCFSVEEIKENIEKILTRGGEND